MGTNININVYFKTWRKIAKQYIHIESTTTGDIFQTDGIQITGYA